MENKAVSLEEMAEVIRIKEHHSDFTYTVDESTVSANGRVFLKGRQSFGFDLDQISRTPIVIERRHPDFRKGLGWLACGCAAFAISRKLESEDVRVTVVCGGVAVVLIGMLLVLTFMRKVRFITLTNHGGQRLFNVIRTHGNSAAVDELLARLGVK